MVNILEAQKEENKNLLEQIDNINKSNEERNEGLKRQIWRIAGQTDTFWYKQLNKKWFEEGKLRKAKDPNDPIEWRRDVERVWFWQHYNWRNVRRVL